MKRFTLFLLVFSLLVPTATAHETMLSSDSPKLVFTEGRATESVPVDGVRLLFSLTTQAGSFSAANVQGSAVVAAIEKRWNARNDLESSVIVSLDQIRQATLSVGRRGRKIEHKFVLELTKFDVGQLHGLVTDAIDHALPLNDELVLDRVQVFLLPETERKVQVRLYENATQEAQTNAQHLVEPTGQKIKGLRYLSAAKDVHSNTHHDEYGFFEGLSKSAFSSVKVRKGFNVSADLPDRLELETSVSGVFEIE